MTEQTSIVFTGVGGQGVITVANLLGKAAVNAKMNVYVSEIHGMAQRGGSVICTVRIGNVTSALLVRGTADALVSTEPIEVLRYISYINKQTKIITDITPTIPSTVAVGGETYPKLDTVFAEIRRHAQLSTIDATAIAKQAGASITKNIVLLGALAAVDVLPFTPKILLETILDNTPPKYKDINKNAFEGGMKAIQGIKK